MAKTPLVLKLTGTIFCDPKTRQLSRAFADQLAQQIKQLSAQYTFGIVVGGGDFFRGAEHNSDLKIRPAVAHTVGMFGTAMNGLILRDIFRSHELATTLLCSLDCPHAGMPVTQDAIDRAIAQEHTIIFSGGTAQPYVTTDTCAVIRALQMGAQQVWKGSDIDGIYTANPRLNRDAKKLTTISYHDIISRSLTFIDHTAVILAQQYKLPIRVFDIFAPNALVHATKDTHGSLITEE